MSRLPIKHPEVHEHFMQGSFRSRFVAKILLDGSHYRRDDQQKHNTQTPGDTKCFSLKGGAVAMYNLISEYRSRYLRQLRAMVGQQYTDFSHPDIQMPKIRRDEIDVQSFVQLMETSWLNPFNPEQRENLSVCPLLMQHHYKDLLTPTE
jgi:hypothetical protein